MPELVSWIIYPASRFEVGMLFLVLEYHEGEVSTQIYIYIYIYMAESLKLALPGSFKGGVCVNQSTCS
jgi:hypothetical protein